MGGKRDKPSGRVSNRRLLRQTAGLFKATGSGWRRSPPSWSSRRAGVVNPVLIAVVFDIALFPTTW